MSSKAETFLSERQLCLALAATGRVTSSEELALWRKNRLLPPLASQGLGTGRGRRYHWHEEDILARAMLVFDGMRRHGRQDHTLIVLFLAGFDVPLPQLRRAWQYRARLCRRPFIRQAVRGPDGMASQGGAHTLLLKTLSCFGAAVRSGSPPERETAVILREALSRLGLASPGANSFDPESQLWHMLGAIAGLLEHSALMGEAGDDELLAAQRYLGAATAFLRDCGGTAETVAEVLGHPLYLIILMMVCSGQRDALEQAVLRIEKANREASPRPPATIHRLPAAAASGIS